MCGYINSFNSPNQLYILAQRTHRESSSVYTRVCPSVIGLEETCANSRAGYYVRRIYIPNDSRALPSSRLGESAIRARSRLIFTAMKFTLSRALVFSFLSQHLVAFLSAHQLICTTLSFGGTSLWWHFFPLIFLFINVRFTRASCIFYFLGEEQPLRLLLLMQWLDNAL